MLYDSYRYCRVVDLSSTIDNCCLCSRRLLAGCLYILRSIVLSLPSLSSASLLPDVEKWTIFLIGLMSCLATCPSCMFSRVCVCVCVCVYVLVFPAVCSVSSLFWPPQVFAYCHPTTGITCQTIVLFRNYLLRSVWCRLFDKSVLICL